MGAFPVSPLNLAAGFATRVGRFRGMSNAVQGHQGSTPARIGVRNSHIGRRARIRPKPRGGERRVGLPCGLRKPALRTLA